MEHEPRRRWQVKTTVFSDWQELTGKHTAREVWAMRRKGKFAVAIPVDNVQRNETRSSKSDAIDDE